MRNIIIQSEYDSIQIYEELLDSIVNHEEISIGVEENVIKCLINSNEEIYIDFLSRKISNHIIENVQPRMIREEVMNDFENYFDESVDQFIKNVTWKLIYKDVNDQLLLEVKDQINHLLTINSFFNLDGFINFGLNKRKKYIQQFISEELDNILDEEEFHNFIDLLKQYITIKIPENDLIHVVMIARGQYDFVTGDRNKIDLTNIEKAYQNMRRSLDDHDDKDFILGVIMSLSPKQIIIHTNHKQDPQISSVLNKLYGDRSLECHGCEFCENLRFSKKRKK